MSDEKKRAELAQAYINKLDAEYFAALEGDYAPFAGHPRHFLPVDHPKTPITVGARELADKISEEMGKRLHESYLMAPADRLRVDGTFCPTCCTFRGTIAIGDMDAKQVTLRPPTEAIKDEKPVACSMCSGSKDV
jgi:hypothetical protein